MGQLKTTQSSKTVISGSLRDFTNCILFSIICPKGLLIFAMGIYKTAVDVDVSVRDGEYGGKKSYQCGDATPRSTSREVKASVDGDSYCEEEGGSMLKYL